jgi:drug/metabolite transporter (DMT)-like permease
VSGFASGLLLLPTVVIWPPWEAGWAIVASAVAQAGYCIALSAAYRAGDLAVAYPIARGTAPLLVTIGAWIVLDQRPGTWAVLGSLSLAIGLVAVARARGEVGSGRTVNYAFVTGCFIATYSLVDARAVQIVEPAGYLAVVFLLYGLLLVPCLGRTWRARLRASARPGAKIGMGSIGAYLLVVLAWQRADAGRVATLRESSILIGLILARTPFRPRLYLGAVAIVIGALLSAL